MTTAPDRASDEVTLRESIPPLREWATTFFVGLCMGSADGVPGVSGGTIALIAGVYERLIAAISAVTPGKFLVGIHALTPFDGGVSLDRAATTMDDVDGWFLLALLAGMVTAVITITGIVEWASREAPILLFGTFFGFIGASAVILLRAISIRTGEESAAALAGFLLAFFVSGQANVLGQGGLPIVFVAGSVAISAMILPGISGALFLVILGQYDYLSTVLHAFIDDLIALVQGGPVGPAIDHGTVVVVFVLGGLVGLFTVARLVRRALDANREATLAFLVALVVGALRAPIAELRGPPYDVTFTQSAILAFAAAAAVGAALVFVLDWYAVDIDLDGV